MENDDPKNTADDVGIKGWGIQLRKSASSVAKKLAPGLSHSNAALESIDQFILKILTDQPNPPPSWLSDISLDTNDPVNLPKQGQETSKILFDKIYDSIERGDHMLLVGPRGCGKSYAVRRALNMGECVEDGQEQSLLVPGAQIIAAGNKEFPRDYFFEPEFEFYQQKNGDRNEELSVRLNQPPLFLWAERDKETGSVELRQKLSDENTASDFVSRHVANFRKDDREISNFVLFLDEINRFNDGVLDSLLLLLEEGCVLYQGKIVEVPAVVIATMNPPGYDVTARSLSPPLMSRFNSVLNLYTAGLKTLVEIILPDELKERDVDLESIPIHLFSATALAFWGSFSESRPCAAYISPEMRDLLVELHVVGDEQFRIDMDYVQSASGYGPDARATRDWILASEREQRISEISYVEAAISTLAEAVGNKLVLNFNPDANPEKLNILMITLGRITRSIFAEYESGEGNVFHSVINNALLSD